MMQKRHSRTGLFMTELILVLFFFSIAAAVCLQVYGKTSLMSEKSKKLRLALNSTENLVQLLKSDAADMDGLTEYVPYVETGEPAVLYYDQEGITCSREEAYYSVELSLEDGEGLYTADLISRDLSGEEIYSLTVNWVPAPEAFLNRKSDNGQMAVCEEAG